MKFLYSFFLVLCPLFSQPNAGPTIVDLGEDFGYRPKPVVTFAVLLPYYQYSWAITSDGKTKHFYFVGYLCDPDTPNPIT